MAGSDQTGFQMMAPDAAILSMPESESRGREDDVPLLQLESHRCWQFLGPVTACKMNRGFKVLAPVVVEDSWAQCENEKCQKWRRLPPGTVVDDSQPW